VPNVPVLYGKSILIHFGKNNINLNVLMCFPTDTCKSFAYIFSTCIVCVTITINYILLSVLDFREGTYLRILYSLTIINYNNTHVNAVCIKTKTINKQLYCRINDINHNIMVAVFRRN